MCIGHFIFIVFRSKRKASLGFGLAPAERRRELADACGSNSPFISNLERGVKVPSLTMVLRLADALKCQVYELVKAFDQNSRY